MWAVRETETPAWWGGRVSPAVSHGHSDILTCTNFFSAAAMGQMCGQMTQTWGWGIGGKASWISSCCAAGG